MCRLTDVEIHEVARLSKLLKGFTLTGNENQRLWNAGKSNFFPINETARGSNFSLS